ncbi:hypothetical protein GCM10027570_46280 [Streptomonospora sediminis]
MQPVHPSVCATERRVGSTPAAPTSTEEPCHGWPLPRGSGDGSYSVKHTSTVYRYITEAVSLLADLATSLADTARTASQKAFVLLDGTFLPIDRTSAESPFYSGTHKRHGINVQVIADPFGNLLWASAALPEPVHDIRAARDTASSTLSSRPASTAERTPPTKAPRARVRVPYRRRNKIISTV